MQVKVYQQLFLRDGTKHQRVVTAVTTGSLHATCTKKFSSVREEICQFSIDEGLVRRNQIEYDRTLIVIDGGKK